PGLALATELATCCGRCSSVKIGLCPFAFRDFQGPAMKLNFRLKEILDEHRVNRRGIIKNITDHTSLERHQVATLMANKTRYLSLDTLAQICDYLIKHHRVNPQDLPGLLFGKEPDSFWDYFAASTWKCAWAFAAAATRPGSPTATPSCRARFSTASPPPAWSRAAKRNFCSSI